MGAEGEMASEKAENSNRGDTDQIQIPRTKGGLVWHVTGLCSCGTGDDLTAIIEVLEFTATDALDRLHGTSGPLTERGCITSVGHELAAKVLDSIGLIEHGSSIRGAWITPKGRTVLDLIRILPDDPPTNPTSFEDGWMPVPDLDSPTNSSRPG
jgi:hypothetical protein